MSAGLFLDFAVLPYMGLIPPDQGVELASAFERKVLLVSWAALMATGLGGFAELFLLGHGGRLVDSAFWSNGYGAALALKLLGWLALLAAHLAYTFAVRPKLVQRLPFDASAATDETSADAARWAAIGRWLLRGEAGASAVAVLVGGALRYGGL